MKVRWNVVVTVICGFLLGVATGSSVTVQIMSHPFVP